LATTPTFRCNFNVLGVAKNEKKVATMPTFLATDHIRVTEVTSVTPKNGQWPKKGQN